MICRGDVKADAPVFNKGIGDGGFEPESKGSRRSVFDRGEGDPLDERGHSRLWEQQGCYEQHKHETGKGKMLPRQGHGLPGFDALKVDFRFLEYGFEKIH